MIDEDRRKEIYITAFKFLIENNISTIPVWAEEICQKLGIELVCLSDIVRNTGLSERNIFGIWGNEDGTLQAYGDICRISFNDRKPIKRQRFTIMEEISHKLLDHISDERFNIFSQSYDEATYHRYEEEARMCAGILLCPPQYFYDDYNKQMSQNLFKDVYNVSAPCAKTRIDVLSKYEYEIKDCELYKLLPKINLDKEYVTGIIFA